jgi:ribonuclease HI
MTQPSLNESIEAKGDSLTSSYKEEMRALGLGIGWLENHPRLHHCTFLTDSLSLLQVMENDQPDTASIRASLQQVCDKVDLLYVPGHRDIPGNELADLHAKAAAALDQPYASEAISFQTARSVIKAEIKDGPTTHRIGSQFYHLVSQDRDDKRRKQGSKVQYSGSCVPATTKAWVTTST